jgi:hypothetical protein
MALAPNCLRVVEALARDYPHEFADCHRPERGARAWMFIRRVAWVLHTTVDQRFGLNGKRGNPQDPSMDAVSFRNPSSPAGGVEIVDVVGGAGGSNPSPAWIDQTQATVDHGTIGVFIQPEPVSGSAPTPAEPPPATHPTVPDSPCRFKACECASADIAGVYEALSNLIVEMHAFRQRQEDLEATAVKDRDDIKQRIERVSQELANKPVTSCRMPSWR